MEAELDMILFGIPRVHVSWGG